MDHVVSQIWWRRSIDRDQPQNSGYKSKGLSKNFIAKTSARLKRSGRFLPGIMTFVQRTTSTLKLLVAPVAKL